MLRSMLAATYATVRLVDGAFFLAHLYSPWGRESGKTALWDDGYGVMAAKGIRVMLLNIITFPKRI